MVRGAGTAQSSGRGPWPASLGLLPAQMLPCLRCRPHPPHNRLCAGREAWKGAGRRACAHLRTALASSCRWRRYASATDRA